MSQEMRSYIDKIKNIEAVLTENKIPADISNWLKMELQKLEAEQDNYSPQEINRRYNELMDLYQDKKYEAGLTKETGNKKFTELLKSLVSFKQVNDDMIKKLINDLNQDELFYDEDEMFDRIKDVVEEYKKFPDPVILYRIVNAKSQEDINLDEVGEHWIADEHQIFDGDFLLSIGWENWPQEDKIFLIAAKVPHSNIDVLQTLVQNISFPNEREINLKNKGRGIKIISITEVNE